MPESVYTSQMAEDNSQPPASPPKEVPSVPNKLETDLLNASFSGDIEAVTKLLYASVNPNTKTSEGETPLLQAAHWGHADVVRALIAAGADPDLANDDGETPLIRAAVYMVFIDSTDVLEALIECGADLTKGDLDGTNAYAWAMRAGNKKGAKYLQSRGVPVPDRLI